MEANFLFINIRPRFLAASVHLYSQHQKYQSNSLFQRMFHMQRNHIWTKKKTDYCEENYKKIQTWFVQTLTVTYNCIIRILHNTYWSRELDSYLWRRLYRSNWRSHSRTKQKQVNTYLNIMLITFERHEGRYTIK